jgi:hypothetical protein
VESQDYADPEGLILLYPSIPLSIDRDGIDEAVRYLQSKDEDEDGGGEE